MARTRSGINWSQAYLISLLAITCKMVIEAYFSAIDVCEMYPSFAFRETFFEEILLHITRLPIIRMPISTILLVVVGGIGYICARCHVFYVVWFLLTELFAFRWLYNVLFVYIPSWFPFFFSEPGIPDLISEDEGTTPDDELPSNPSPTKAAVSSTAYKHAMNKLLEAKAQYANMTITRPSSWLVYDASADDLVPLTPKAQDEDENEEDNR